MNNQDLARSTADVASTPSPDADQEAQQPTQVVGAPVEPGNTPHTPSGSADSAAVEAENMPSLPTESVYEAPPPFIFKFLRGLAPFWHDRLIEAGLILSMGLYYLVGNPTFGAGPFLHLPPYLYSFPFLAIFACLSWYRLPFAVALLPLSLPYYLYQKAIFSHSGRDYDFSLVEISLYTCVLVAVGQLLVQEARGKRWRYRLTWAELRARVGIFIVPMAVFFLAALVSVFVAVDRQTALRAFREEVVGPLIYVLLALCCLRTRQDVKRLLYAFLGCALVIAFAGLIQYFFFPSVSHSIYHPVDSRAHAMYGSANSIGLFFDYALPIGLALLFFQVGKAFKAQNTWWTSAVLLVGFVPLVGVLYLSQSLGSALALPVALLFILALSVRDRKKLLLGAIVLVVLIAATGVVLRHQITHFIETWHDNTKGISTVSKRIYLWLSAWHMIQDHPVFGVGMDNWLCYYSPNTICVAPATTTHYWLVHIPGTNISTGLSDEPGLSHPHDIFLHVWVSIGIFGLLVFMGLLSLFFWLFARVVKTVRAASNLEVAGLEWMVLGIGGAMLAALCQGLIDSAFLEQDLAFCFWMLVAALLLLRVQTGTAWRSLGGHRSL